MAPTAPRGARRQTLLGLAFASPFLIGAAVFIVWPVVA